MTFVITKACIGSKDRSCVEVCPVDCFYDIRKIEYNQMYGIAPPREGECGVMMIHPDECIDCGACAQECPVNAIYEYSEVPEDMKEFIDHAEKELLSMKDEDKELIRCTSKR